MKKMVSVLLSAAVCFSALSAFPSGAVGTDADIIAVSQNVGASSGSCGENARWTLSDNKLTITGTGKMTTYTALRQIPWYFMREKIYELEISEGITSIGASAFLELINIKTITIPSTVKALERSCFEGCSGVEVVDIPVNVENIYASAFRNCKSLKAIYIRNPECSIGGTSETICNVAVDSGTAYSGVIYGYSGSYAEKYANSYDKNFAPIEAAPPITSATTMTTTTTTTTTSTTTTTTSKPATTTTTTTTQPPVTPPDDYDLGDVNNDGFVDAVDASMVLSEYARLSANQNAAFTDKQRSAANVNGDGYVDAVDASNILAYYAYLSSESDNILTISEFIKK